VLLNLLFVNISDDRSFHVRSELWPFPCISISHGPLEISAEENFMRCFRHFLASAAFLWLSAAPLFAQSPVEEIGPIPLHLDPEQWALLETLKPAITEFLVLPEGTPVSLEFLTLVTTRTAKRGDRVKFQVVSDVSVEGLTIIPKGSVVWGTVTLAKKPGRFSRDGKLQIALNSVTLLNGQTIAIRKRPPPRPPAGGWLSGPDSLQAPLLAVVGVGIFAVAPPEDRDAFFGSILAEIIARGHHTELPPGTRVEALISQFADLNREEFGKLQPVARGQVP
jgi:hypothetical protein